MTTPYWIQDSIFYQIFPDRFANGDKENDPPNVQPWGSPPTSWAFQGGDLRGIIQHFDYLLDLGINAIYLNPIFLSSSNHRYNTTDYMQIDPKLGSLKDFHSLIDIAHRNNVRIILDGVFNHCGRGFFAFNDVLENGEHSPYKEWFYINQFPIDAFGPDKTHHYQCWWDHKSLPKLNTSNIDVRDYIFRIARYWIEQGADGWRLDVPNEIDDDKFWIEFRQAIRSTNRDACLIGEIWDINPRWANESHFDGLMNYPVKDALLRLLRGDHTPKKFDESLNQIINAYPRENLYAMYVPLDSHDTERFITSIKGNIDKLKLAYLFQMAFPGAPAIYYGSEIGLEGGKDPDSRRAFPWEETDWDQSLRSFIKTLISLRKNHTCLRRGNFIGINLSDDIYSFGRQLGEESVAIAMNISDHESVCEISTDRLFWEDGRILHGLFDYQSYLVQNGKLIISLPAWSGTWIG